MRLQGGLFTIATIAVFAGCGPKAAPVAPDSPDDTVTGTGEEVGTSADPTPDTICDRIFELQAEGCSVTSGYGLSPEECRVAFSKALNDRGPESSQANLALGRCLVDKPTCGEVDQCITDISAPHQPQVTRTCEDSKTYAPVGYPPAEYAKRKGANMTRYSQHASTQESPIEVCTIPGQLEWLTTMTCDDGSRPFKTQDHAHDARVRNTGEGGRCGAIIDLYEVPCPEGTYSIYIDAYVCPLE